MNSYGTKFRLSIFGESHGPLIGVVLDGVPAGMPLSREDFLADLDRRRSGAKGSTPRKESDLPEIVSGVCDGHTTGAPLTIVFRNSNTRSGDYSDFRATPRPGHADFVAERKYRAFNDLRGGGHFSGRLTLTLVAAGVVAKKMIGPIEIRARITELGGIPRERLNCKPGKELGAEGAPTLWDELIDRTLRCRYDYKSLLTAVHRFHQYRVEYLFPDDACGLELFGKHAYLLPPGEILPDSYQLSGFPMAEHKTDELTCFL